MARKRRNNRRSRGKRNTSNASHANYSVGPIEKSGVYQKGSVSLQQQKVYDFFLRTAVSGVTSSSSVITVTIALNDPSATTDWTSLAGLFDQYRVRTVHITWIPAQAAGGTDTVRPLYIGVDYDSSSVGATTADQILQRGTTRIYNINQPIKHSIKMPIMTEANNPLGWQDCATPIAQGVAQILSTGLATAAAYGSYIIEYDVQFKSRL